MATAAVAEWIVWLCGLGLCVFQVLLQIADGSLREFYFISDLLYIPTLFEDLSRWSGNIVDWRSPPSPYYFPDLPLYAAARSLGLSIEWSQYTSGIALLLLCIWTARLTIVRAAPKLKEASACFAASLSLGFPLLQGHPVNWLTQLTVLSVHGGAVFGTFAVLALCFGRGPDSWRIYSVLTAVAFAAGASDALYGASCGVPLLSVAAVELLRKPERARRFLCGGVAGLLGVVASSVIHSQTTARYVQPRAAHWADCIQHLAADVMGPARAVMWPLAASVAVSLYVLARRSSKVPDGLRTLGLWHVLSTVCTLSAMVLGGRYSDISRMRYLVVPLATSGVLLSTCVAEILRRALGTHDSARPLWALAMLMLFCVVSWRGAQLLRQGSYAAHIRDQIACVKAAAGSREHSVILTDYWNAKPLMLFSGGELRALQMEQGLAEPRWWINSRGWYRDASQLGAVVTNDLGRNEIAGVYGSPSRIEQCGELELYIYEGEARAWLARAMSEKFQRFVAE